MQSKDFRPRWAEQRHTIQSSAINPTSKGATEYSNYIQRVIEPKSPINTLDFLHILLLEIKPQHIQILRQSLFIITLRYNRHIPLRRPPQQYLCRRLPMLLRNLFDGRMFQQKGRIFGLLHIEFQETLRAEGAVGCDGDAFILSVFDETFLHEVGVVFDLEGCGADFGIAEEIHYEDAAEVADADALA